jgi:hypothetical protein
MTNVKKMMVEVKDADAPELHVVVAADIAAKKPCLSAPLVVPSRNYSRPPRAELAVLGWNHRATRLSGNR